LFSICSQWSYARLGGRGVRSLFIALRKGARSQLLPVCLILVVQTAASRVLAVPERHLQLPGLQGLPLRFGEWQEREEQALDPNTREYLHPDEYILRDYVKQGPGVSINLFVAYFKSLQDSYGPHSPRVCLPGVGWLVRSSRTASIAGRGMSRNVPVNEYVLEKSGNRILVVYWYQNERDVWADEFWAKIRLLPDLIRYQRSDISLVRLVSPVTGSENDFGNCLEFAKLIFPALNQHFEASR
jgi:EpsI family protein